MIEPGTLSKYLPSSSMIMLIDQCLKSEDTEIEAFSAREIKERFHIGTDAQRSGKQALSQ